MFKNLKLGTRKIGGFVLVVLLMTVVGALGMYSLEPMGGDFDVTMNKEVPMP